MAMTNKEDEVKVARIYITEGDHKVRSLMSLLHDEEKVSGVTVFRGISGFGKSGKMHSSDLLDLLGRLPVVIEFFDSPEKVDKILSHLESELEPGHIVTWRATKI
jgi:PII-like signaling protein